MDSAAVRDERHIGQFTPLGAAVQALRDAMAGVSPHASTLAVLGACTVFCGGMATRRFRWD